jgi:alkylation response protein AidB-like acyl-CoA dehydrogenase
MPRVSQRYAAPPGDGARALRSAPPVGVAAEVVSAAAAPVPGWGAAAVRVAAAVPVLGSGAEAVRVAREFADSVAEGAIERDRSGAGPGRELAALDASGLLGITVPRRYGGADVSACVLAEVVRVIAAADPAIAQLAQGHFLLVDVLAALGTPSQRHRLLTDVLAGARLSNGMAERGGQHAQDLKTRLSGGSTGTWLTGRKYHCMGAPTARWIGVTALDEADRLVLAFVERDAPGVHLDEDWNQRGTVSGGVRFDDVAVDPCLVIPYYRAFEAPPQVGALPPNHGQICG